MNPQFPLYIPSKSRADSRLTVKALQSMNVPFHVVVEAHQFDDYAAVIDPASLLILPQEYLENYETFDNLGASKSRGPGAARNFAWDHSIANGHAWHWVMDDNIAAFWRLQYNRKIKVSTGAIFRAMEDFCLRYENVAMAGPNYMFFAKRKQLIPPFITNTRIYSCNLIRNDVPYRWRGRYNEDTDLSLRMLKDGWVTVQFNAFLQGKVRTSTVAGGNTEEFYSREGTYPKSKMLVDMHPDVARMTWKFKRWHHEVDYRPFKANKLVRRPDYDARPEPDNFGMALTSVR